MSFSTNVPNASQSPGMFPSQSNTNFSRLETIIGGDHVFNNSVQADDGAHKQVTYVARSDPTALPSGTNGIGYVKTVGGLGVPHYYNGTTVFVMAPVLAKITFSEPGTTLGNAYHCSAAKLSQAKYQVTFSPALPDTNVQFSISGIDSTGGTVIGRVTAFTTSSMTFEMVNDNGTLLSTLTSANLIVFGG